MYGTYEIQTLYNNGNYSFESLNRSMSNIADSISAFLRRPAQGATSASSSTSVTIWDDLMFLRTRMCKVSRVKKKSIASQM